jgi:glyoxylase-like metal-dependent hydrolase (beta-lactamase superfamily II)
MKKVVFSVIIIVSLIAGTSSLSAIVHIPLYIRQLTDSTYIFITFGSVNGVQYPSNGMYFITDSGIVMLDTPWDTNQVKPLLDSIQAKHNQKVKLCISTHSHEDRTAGLEILRKNGVRTYTSFLTDSLCKLNGEKRAEFHFLNDTTFSLGNLKFETFYPGAGHSQDNLVIWIPDLKILYGGCLIKSTIAYNLGNTAGADIDSWVKVMSNLISKYPDAVYVVPGHSKTGNFNTLQHTLDLLNEYKSKNK